MELRGTLERYMPGGIVVRLGGTDVMSVIRATTVVRNNQMLVEPAQPVTHSRPLAWGVGLRF